MNKTSADKVLTVLRQLAKGMYGIKYCVKVVVDIALTVEIHEIELPQLFSASKELKCKHPDSPCID